MPWGAKMKLDQLVNLNERSIEKTTEILSSFIEESIKNLTISAVFTDPKSGAEKIKSQLFDIHNEIQNKIDCDILVNDTQLSAKAYTFWIDVAYFAANKLTNTETNDGQYNPCLMISIVLSFQRFDISNLFSEKKEGFHLLTDETKNKISHLNDHLKIISKYTLIHSEAFLLPLSTYTHLLDSTKSNIVNHFYFDDLSINVLAHLLYFQSNGNKNAQHLADIKFQLIETNQLLLLQANQIHQLIVNAKSDSSNQSKDKLEEELNKLFSSTSFLNFIQYTKNKELILDFEIICDIKILPFIEKLNNQIHQFKIDLESLGKPTNNDKATESKFESLSAIDFNDFFLNYKLQIRSFGNNYQIENLDEKLYALLNKKTDNHIKNTIRNDIFNNIIKIYKLKNNIPLEKDVINPKEIIYEAMNQFIDKVIAPYLAHCVAESITKEYYHKPKESSVFDFFNDGFQLISESTNKNTQESEKRKNESSNKPLTCLPDEKLNKSRSQTLITRTRAFVSKPNSAPSCNQTTQTKQESDEQNTKAQGSKIQKNQPDKKLQVISSFPLINKQASSKKNLTSYSVISRNSSSDLKDIKETPEKEPKTQTNSVDNLSEPKEKETSRTNTYQKQKNSSRKNTIFDTLTTKLKPSNPTNLFQIAQETDENKTLLPKSPHQQDITHYFQNS